MRKIKAALGRRKLAKEHTPPRERSGFSFHTAARVGILYVDIDEDHYRMIRNFAREIKEKFGVKTVRALGFVDEVSKNVPSYQSHKLEFEFFTREELNWHMKPVKKIESFVHDQFDILIDLSGGNNLSMNYIMKESPAKMKIAPRETRAATYADLVLDMGNRSDPELFIEQLNLYLSNSKFK